MTSALETVESVGVSTSPIDPEVELGIEVSISWTAKVVEGLLYLSLTSSVLGEKIGMHAIPGSVGAVIAICGSVTFLFWVLTRTKFPISIWFAIALNFAANVSQAFRGVMPVIGEGVSSLFHWLSFLLMLCFVTRDGRAQKRVLAFLWMIYILAVIVGGIGRGGYGRLELEGVAGSFSNPNTIAYIGGILLVSLLFWSLRSAVSIKPALWAMAGSLFVVIVMTLSRGGILAAAIGGMLFMSSIMLGRGVRLSGIIAVSMLVIGLSQMTFLFSESVSRLEGRIAEEGLQSPRLRVYSMGTLENLADTFWVGWGTNSADHQGKSAAGVEAHNSFLYTHMAFGGIAAWILVVWQGVLGVRLFRMLFGSELGVSRRLEIVALCLMVAVAQLLSNVAFLYVSSVYAIAMIEKYTAPFSANQIRRRRRAAFAARALNAG